MASFWLLEKIHDGIDALDVILPLGPRGFAYAQRFVEFILHLVCFVIVSGTKLVPSQVS